MEFLKRFRFLFLGLVVLTAFTLIVALYRKGNTPIERVDYVLDTVVVQNVAGRHAVEAATEVAEYLRDFEYLASSYLPSSQVAKINAEAGKNPVQVDGQLFELISRSLELCRETGGAVDITIQPISSLWDFKADKPSLPRAEDLVRGLSLVDWSSVQLDKGQKTVYLPSEGQGLDLGAVAKGFLCDQLGAIYEKHQVKYAVASLGGNVYVYGKRDKVFTVGLRSPFGEDEGFVGLLTVDNQVIATSGGYERSFELEGQTYHHILDPVTGYPAQSDLVSVTVISEDGLLSDFLSTYFFIEGSGTVEQALKDERFSIVAITQDKRLLISEQLGDSFVLTDPSFTQYVGSAVQ